MHRFTSKPLLSSLNQVARPRLQLKTYLSSSVVYSLPVCQKQPWCRGGGLLLFSSSPVNGNPFLMPFSSVATQTGIQAGMETHAIVESEAKPAMDSQITIDNSLERPKYIKTKKLTKTAAYIMQIINKDLVTEARSERPVPSLRAGDIVQLKVETPENKRRVSTFRGIVMGVNRCGYSTTFRIRRFVAGVGLELIFPLYSPNIKEIKVLDHRKVRRNKLYYLRDKMGEKKNRIT